MSKALYAIMNNTVFAIVILFFTQTSFSQQFAVQAVNFDQNAVPYKIETKQIDGDVVVYVKHNNNSSVCVKRQTSYSGDTTIIREASYSVYYKKSKIEELHECDTWFAYSNTAGDTLWLQGYMTEYNPYTLVFVGDTMLTGELGQNSEDFYDQLKWERVPLILNGEIKINTDSLILNETVIAYFLNGIPIKIVRYNSMNNRQSMVTSDIGTNGIIYCKYFAEDEPILYQVDTVSWNNDTSYIRWSSTRLDWEETFVSEYQVAGDILRVISNGIAKREIKFLENRCIFRNLLISDLLYNDVLYYMELRLFDREKIVSKTTGSNSLKNEYTFDHSGRIIEQLVIENGQLQKRVVFKYED